MLWFPPNDCTPSVSQTRSSRHDETPATVSIVAGRVDAQDRKDQTSTTYRPKPAELPQISSQTAEGNTNAQHGNDHGAGEWQGAAGSPLGATADAANNATSFAWLYTYKVDWQQK